MTLWQVFMINVVGGLLTGLILAYKMGFNFKKICESKVFSNIRIISAFPSVVLLTVTTLLYFIPTKIQLNNFPDLYANSSLVGKFLIRALGGSMLGFTIPMIILMIKQIKEEIK